MVELNDPSCRLDVEAAQIDRQKDGHVTVLYRRVCRERATNGDQCGRHGHYWLEKFSVSEKTRMQPPPRKVKIATVLRNIHNEQFTKLQAKHQIDIDLLEDIRTFTKIRASIEKDYSQALLKLSTTYLQRKFLTGSEAKSDNGNEKTVYAVWRMLLDETEKIAKARLAAVEVYQQQISESAKGIRTSKIQIAKKSFDNLRKIHEEIQQCVQEIDKTKKFYYEEEHMAHGARDKAQDAEEKLKRKKGRIFQSFQALQKNSARFSSRKEACDIQSTSARNEYILALVAANAHQKRFYEQDLPELMQTMDCGFCDKVKDYLTLMSRTELLTCAACQNSYTVIQQAAEQINGKHTMDRFLNENPVVGNIVQYNFDACDNDEVQMITTDHNAELCLSKEARKWASCIAKESRTLRDAFQEIHKVQAAIASGEKISQTSGGESGGAQIDPETRLDELKQIVRKAETSKLKAEARVEVLRDGGVNVDEWLKSVDIENLAAIEELSRKGSTYSRASRLSIQSENVDEGSSEANDSFYDSDFNEGSSDLSGTPQPPIENQTEDTTAVEGNNWNSENAWDPAQSTVDAWDATQSAVDAWNTQVTDDDLDAQIDSTQPAEIISAAVVRCLALFNYEAANADELSFVEQEELEIVAESDGDGWIKARNYKGEEGYVPENYVEVVPETYVEAADGEQNVAPAQRTLVSFSSVDYTVGDENEMPIEPQEESNHVEDVHFTFITDDIVPDTNGIYCRALYDYEATCDEELTFMEGQVIHILRKLVHDVDDGWWEGEFDGQTGIFPSLVVEEIKYDGAPQTPEDVKTPPGSAPPPVYTPPKPQFLLPPAQVILTQPTPEVEHAGEITDQKSQPAAPTETGDTYIRLVSSPDSPSHDASAENEKAGCSGDEKLTDPVSKTTEVQITKESESPSLTSEVEICDTTSNSYQSADDLEKNFNVTEELSEDSVTDVTVVEAPFIGLMDSQEEIASVIEEETERVVEPTDDEPPIVMKGSDKTSPEHQESSNNVYAGPEEAAKETETLPGHAESCAQSDQEMKELL